MRKKFILILIVFVAVAIVASPESESATISLNPTDDAGVWNGWPTGTIDRKHSWGMANTRDDDPRNYDIVRAFFKFDLGDIPDSSQNMNTELRLYAMLSEDGKVNFWYGSHGGYPTKGWGSSYITSDSHAVDDFLAQLGILDRLSSLNYIDITEGWDSTIDLIDNYHTIAITMANETPGDLVQAELISGGFVSYPPFYRPLLTIELEEITSVPLPAAAWFFGAGVIAIIGCRRRSKFNG